MGVHYGYVYCDDAVCGVGRCAGVVAGGELDCPPVRADSMAAGEYLAEIVAAYLVAEVDR
ncbi:MAG: hypothetical protein ACRDQY_07420 [Pseudonocardiaceae bacterium]